MENSVFIKDFEKKPVFDFDEEVEKSVNPNAPKWIRGPLLAKGGFGSVFLAEMIETTHVLRGRARFHQPMVVKTTLFSKSELVNEKKILDLFVNCPFIIQCYGDDTTISILDCGNGIDKEVTLYNVFLEYASGGTLFDFIKDSPLYNESKQIKQFLQEILIGVKCIHEKGIVHCDLKLENILLVKEREEDNIFVAKICDFGLSKMSGDWMTPIQGTKAYWAPECVSENPIQEQYSDIWAIGVMVLYMLTKKLEWSEELSKHISEEAKDFLMRCFETNPLKRPSAKMLLGHPFVTGKKIIKINYRSKI